jgi:tetratricopeptide (TPR) repeat protein
MITNVLVLLGLVLGEGAGPPAARAAAAPPVAGPASPSSSSGDSSSSSARTAAKAALAEGNRRLKDGDVAGAIADYRRAQAVYPPAADKLEFNIAKAEEARGDEPAAAAAFDRFLSQSLEIPPEYREEARNELRRLSGALGALRLAEKRPGYEVLVDGRQQGKTPLDRDVWVRPGHHVITLEQDDRVLFRDDVTVASGATLQITVTLRQPDDAADAARTPRPAIALANPAPAAAAQPAALVALPTPAAPDVHEDVNAKTSDDRSAPLWKRWWFWAAAGAVLAAGGTLLVLETRDGCPSGYTCKPVQ